MADPFLEVEPKVCATCGCDRVYEDGYCPSCKERRDVVDESEFLSNEAEFEARLEGVLFPASDLGQKRASDQEARAAWRGA